MHNVYKSKSLRASEGGRQFQSCNLLGSHMYIS